MKIYSGTSGYGYQEWKGNFYPEKISPQDMLRFYASLLPTVEINNTFYRLPTGGVLTSWSEQVPADFIFAFKAPQVITHRKRLKNVGVFFKHEEEGLGPKLARRFQELAGAAPKRSF